MRFELSDADGEAVTRVGPVLGALAAVQDRHEAFRVEAFGDASAQFALEETIQADFTRAEYTALPVTLGILVVVFGALVAAGIPLLVGLSAVAAAIGLLALPSRLFAMDEAANSVILLIGLAVSVDYSLFYLKREREERAAGKSEQAALAAAAATSGRAILISGLTVIAAVAGMFFGGSAIWTSVAIGTILVVAIAVVGSLTVLPATLGWLGDRVERGRIPLLSRRQASAESRVWGGIVDRVLRRPALSVALAGGLLVTLAVPTLFMRTADSGIEALPRSLEIVQTYERVQESFPGGPLPAVVAIRAADVTAPEVRAGIAELRAEAVETGLMAEPITVRSSEDGSVALVSVPLAGSGTDEASARALEALRRDVIPATIGSVGGVEVAVDRPNRALGGLQGADGRADAAGDGLRARARLRAPAGRVPLGRDRREGGAPEPALGRRRLRSARGGLPVGLGRAPARLRVDGRDRVRPAALPLRRPLRPLDGLPRLHPQPDPGGLRRRALDGGSGRARDPDDRRARFRPPRL